MCRYGWLGSEGVCLACPIGFFGVVAALSSALWSVIRLAGAGRARFPGPVAGL